MSQGLERDIALQGLQIRNLAKTPLECSTSQGCKETLLGYVIEFHETLDEGCKDEVTLESNDFRVGSKRAIVRDVEWFGAVEEDECVR